MRRVPLLLAFSSVVCGLAATSWLRSHDRFSFVIGNELVLAEDTDPGWGTGQVGFEAWDPVVLREPVRRLPAALRRRKGSTVGLYSTTSFLCTARVSWMELLARGVDMDASESGLDTDYYRDYVSPILIAHLDRPRGCDGAVFALEGAPALPQAATSADAGLAARAIEVLAAAADFESKLEELRRDRGDPVATVRKTAVLVLPWKGSTLVSASIRVDAGDHWTPFSDAWGLYLWDGQSLREVSEPREAFVDAVTSVDGALVLREPAQDSRLPAGAARAVEKHGRFEIAEEVLGGTLFHHDP